MSEDAILRLRQTDLFKKLREKEKEETKETALEDYEISQNIISVVRKAAPLLERVPENMPEFTLHNANHSVHIIENIEKIIPCETLKQLNAIEISILIYAAYLHDIGMIASSDERKQIVKTSEFKKHLTSNEELYEKFEEAKNNGDYEAALDIENKAFTDFLRKNHVQHAHKIIEEYELDSEISWKDIPYYNWVMAVCDSHELPVKDLYNTKSWPNDTFVRDKPVNVQYLAVIFRLADKLDIDPERTPKRLFYYLNPKDEISIKEWNKHLSITGFSITPEKTKIVADCKHPEQERTLRKFIKEIDKEIEYSYRLVSSYRDKLEEKYTLKLSEPVDEEIHSIGYEYCDFHFELDYRRVLDLLMGERLYGDPIVALRELLQNSVDAVRYRESLEKRDGNGYTPSIEVSLKNDELVVEDNGIGMDEGIFENYFMKVGRSYYQSLDFRQKNLDVDPVSEFGIGILSVFMVANKFTVESRRKMFEEELNQSKSIYFEIPTAYDYFIKKQSKRLKYGTKITLHLKPNHPFSTETLMETISKIAPFIEYQIIIHAISGKEIYKSLLPGDIPENFSYTKEYFEVTFNNVGEHEGIEGVLRVAKAFNSSQLIAQKGFSIPDCSWGGFHPVWASINLSGQAKLTLSPNRSLVIKDEKYYNLADKLQSKIFSEFERHLRFYRDSNTFRQYVKYVNELLQEELISLGERHAGRYVGSKLNKFMKMIFLKYVPLPTISENGEVSYQIIKDLDKLPTVVITSFSDWPEKITEARIFEEIKSLINPNVVILLGRDNNDRKILDFLYYIFGVPSDIYITSLPGVVIEKFTRYNKIPGIFTIGLNHFALRMNSKVGTKEPLFVHYPENIRDPDHVIFNSQHRLLSRFIDGILPRDENSLKALEFLYNSFGSALNDLSVTICSQYYQQKCGIEYSDNQNCMLIGVLNYYPELLEELRKAADNFWKNAQYVGAIPYGEEFPGFTIEDLPWFWSCDFKESTNY